MTARQLYFQLLNFILTVVIKINYHYVCQISCMSFFKAEVYAGRMLEVPDA